MDLKLAKREQVSVTASFAELHLILQGIGLLLDKPGFRATYDEQRRKFEARLYEAVHATKDGVASGKINKNDVPMALAGAQAALELHEKEIAAADGRLVAPKSAEHQDLWQKVHDVSAFCVGIAEPMISQLTEFCAQNGLEPLPMPEVAATANQG